MAMHPRTRPVAERSEKLSTLPDVIAHRANGPKEKWAFPQPQLGAKSHGAMTRPEVLVPTELYLSAVVEAPVDDVWSLIGNFDNLGAINAMFNCEMEDGAHHKQVGAVRVVRIQGLEGLLREYLLAFSDMKPFPSLTYGFHPPPPGEKSLVPLPRYDTVNTTSVRPITLSEPSRTLVEVTSKFLAEPQNVAELKEQTEGFFKRFLGMIQDKFVGKSQ